MAPAQVSACACWGQLRVAMSVSGQRPQWQCSTVCGASPCPVAWSPSVVSPGRSIPAVLCVAGGGHKASAEALKQAMEEKYGDRFKVRVTLPTHKPSARGHAWDLGSLGAQRACRISHQQAPVGQASAPAQGCCLFSSSNWATCADSSSRMWRDSTCVNRVAMCPCCRC
jgi:hypothetical protein